MDALRDRFLARQLAGDRAGAVEVVLGALREGAPPREVQLGVIAAAQREIGRLWQLNRVSIAQEHLATAIAQLALARVYQGRAAATPRGKVVLLACVEGEHHDFGPRIAADVLEAAGHDVRFLGANVPTDSLVDLACRIRPDVACLSATMVFHLPALRAAVAGLRAAAPRTRVLVGGWALDQVRRAPEGAEHAGSTADDLLAALAARPGVAA